MGRFDSYVTCRAGKASVERFLLLRQERQMIADARGYMGDHWHLPFTGEIVEVALDSSREQADVDNEERADEHKEE